MTRILVTGATGNVGTHVVRELRSRGATVRAFVRTPTGLGEGVELARGDFDDPAALKRALRDVDRVYVCAADGPHKVRHETAVIDAAAEQGVERVVKLSALHADPASPLPAFRWHGEIEAHLRRSGVPAVVLRPAFFMTNLLMVAEGVARTGTLYAPTAGRRVAMIDIRDVAEVAAVTLLDDPSPAFASAAPSASSRVYDLTGPAAVTFAEVAAALAAATGSSVEFADLTEEQARPRFEGADLPAWLAAHLAGVFALVRAGGFERTTGTVRALTGRPARDVSAFARDFADAFRQPILRR